MATMEWMRREFSRQQLPDPVTGIKWLPPGSILAYYQECKRGLESLKLTPVTYQRFDQYWLSDFRDYRILSGKRAQKCKMCGSFYTRLCQVLDPAERSRIEEERAAHLSEVRVMRRRYYTRQRLAEIYPWIFLSIIADGNTIRHVLKKALRRL